MFSFDIQIELIKVCINKWIYYVTSCPKQINILSEVSSIKQQNKWIQLLANCTIVFSKRKTLDGLIVLLLNKSDMAKNKGTATQ